MANDSVSRTFGVALGVCLVCSVLVSAAAVSLRPTQAVNKTLDKKRNILMAAGLLKSGEVASGERIDELYQNINTRVVDLATGEYVDGVDPIEYDQRRAAKDPEQSEVVPADVDIANVKRRALHASVYLVSQKGKIKKVILPVHGLGLWSTLYGFVALDARDLNTIRGLVYYEHAETPGLGGEVDNPSWKALWDGKKAFDESGAVRIEVIRVRSSRDGPKPSIRSMGCRVPPLPRAASGTCCATGWVRKPLGRIWPSSKNEELVKWLTNQETSSSGRSLTPIPLPC